MTAVPAARRGLVVTIAALAVVTLGGCGSSTTSQNAGSTLTLYSLAPLHGPPAQRSRDIVDGEKLALQQSGGQLGGLSLNFRSADSGKPDGSATPLSAATAAHSAAQDGSAIGIVGDVGTTATETAIPLTNAGGDLQVTPAATYAGLTTSRGAAVPDQPARLYPTGRRTFARVIGSDLTQAPAIVRLARRAGCRSLDVVSGAAPEERSLARLVREASGGRARVVAAANATGATGATRAPCAFVSVEQPQDAAPLMRALHRAHPAMTLLAPASLVDPWLARALGPAAAVTRLLSPVPRLADLPPAAHRFAAAFHTTFGRAPGPYAFLGYDAMRGIIAAIERAGPRGGDRDAVVAAFLGHPRPSVLGTASTKTNGDTTLAPWAQARIHHGRIVLGKRV